MDSVIECSQHMTLIEETAVSQTEWNENTWTMIDFNEAFEDNLNLDAPFTI